MKTLNCPGCGQTITFLDENREFGFCEYCGTKVQLNEIVTYKHTGSVNLEGVATIRSLCEKGFQEINAKDYLGAAKTFDRAAELDCNDIEVMLGKSLVKQNKRTHTARGELDTFTTFDEYYFSQLQKKEKSISTAEQNRINDYNCKLFLKLYCFMWDAARTEYVLDRFPDSIDMELLDHEHFSDAPARTTICFGFDEQYRDCIVKMLDINNPVNVIQLMLSNKIKVSTIFNYLFFQAYQKTFDRKITRDYFHAEILPVHVLCLLEKEGQVGSTNIPICTHYYDDGYHLTRDKTIPFYSISQYVTLLGGEDYNTIFDSYKKNDWKKNNRCQYCGSSFKGLFQKVCSNPKCGKPKDY